ncbi:hypothetical protein TWF694_006082 [Orbilia ellipsospora]|uniref:MACPF-like domain-containing protein n=1 Tax=Orbilia ellipsospora TaxID=2528407 RepID=A0AAV9WR56_9PEZI
MNGIILILLTAFRLRDGLNVYQNSGEDTTTAASNDKTIANAPAATSQKITGIPNFVVNDNSKIEIETVEHEFGMSLAENHFDTTTVEVSGSGVVEDVSAGGSVGHTEDKSGGSSSINKTFHKKYIATYKFPRATIYLNSEDLQPTEDLKQSLDVLNQTKDINVMRYIHKTYGQLFCHQVLIGACLRSTKELDVTQSGSETITKERFKTNVGAAVAFPGVASFSTNISNEQGNSSQAGTQTKDDKETIVFVATGGNTILGTNPPLWSISALDYRNWRIIGRDSLSPIVSAISRMKRFEDVNKWFMSAVPKLMERMIVPDTRVLDVRLRVRGGTENTAISRITGSQVQTYFAHDPAYPPKPIHTGIKTKTVTKTPTEAELTKMMSDIQSNTDPQFDPAMLLVGAFGLQGIVLAASLTTNKKESPVVDLTKYTSQVTLKYEDAMFFPASIQAPVLLPRTLKNTSLGDASKDDLNKTMWRFEIPTGSYLSTESLISVKSWANEAFHHLTVYRNEQGIFMPAITDSYNPSVWRVEKLSGVAGSSIIKTGDIMRLCWRFSDQKSGFRDFQDDIYGRLRYTKPEEIASDTLYFKVPWPRFENMNAESGVSLLMSTNSSNKPFWESINTLPSRSSNRKNSKLELHDVQFRIDYCDEETVEGKKDFMFQNTSTAAQTETEMSKTSSKSVDTKVSRVQKSTLDPFGPEAFVARILFGPSA